MIETKRLKIYAASKEQMEVFTDTVLYILVYTHSYILESTPNTVCPVLGVYINLLTSLLVYSIAVLPIPCRIRRIISWEALTAG